MRAPAEERGLIAPARVPDLRRLVDGKEGWRQVVEEGRDRLHRQQLRSAMRRNTAFVKQFMREEKKQA
ncbi:MULTISPECIES: hypothetical protein [Streptomyces]|uniref:Uncharacterized protein n=1 Tax=Streptomyces tendae TaxID=1932 RepID=A0ABX5ZTZ5_STRTE|nr:hypothetical protein [Streptomyces tendae]QER87685.1 hypothetical protein F3L20_19130 [Streptomyces tendae]